MKTERPIEDDGKLRPILEKLANISAIAFSLKHELAPLTQEDLQDGMEPLMQEQIQGALDSIQNEIFELALFDLGASKDEWYAANDTVQ